MRTEERIEVREFRIEDMKTVVGLLQSVSRFEPKSDSLEQLANQFIEGKNRHACVAINDGQVIGIGSIFVLQRIRGGCSAIIEDVAVDKSFRSQGIGARIVRSLIVYAKKERCFKVTLVTGRQNMAFYRSLGFTREKINMGLLF